MRRQCVRACREKLVSSRDEEESAFRIVTKPPSSWNRRVGGNDTEKGPPVPGRSIHVVRGGSGCFRVISASSLPGGNCIALPAPLVEILSRHCQRFMTTSGGCNREEGDSHDTCSTAVVPCTNNDNSGSGRVLCGFSRLGTDDVDGHHHWSGHRSE